MADAQHDLGRSMKQVHRLASILEYGFLRQVSGSIPIPSLVLSFRIWSTTFERLDGHPAVGGRLPTDLDPQYGVEGGALPELYLGPNRGTATPAPDRNPPGRGRGGQFRVPGVVFTLVSSRRWISLKGRRR